MTNYLTTPSSVGVGHFDALLDALDRLHGTGPEFGGYLTNHGPMAADALSRLGAPDLVPSWVDTYRLQVEEAPASAHEVTAENWRRHLGDVRLVGDWTEHFERAIRSSGWRNVLNEWWPRLLPGAAAGGAHGLIRTAHAIRSLADATFEHDLLSGEFARGLAYWAARYQPLPGHPSLAGQSTAVTAIAQLPRLSPDVPSMGPGFIGRFAALVALRDLPDALDSWGVDDLAASLDELISAAARVLANRVDGSIAFCHAVTAPAAVQMILGALPSELRATTVSSAWQIVGAIVAGYGYPATRDELVDVNLSGAPSPIELATSAIEHGDDHVIKLTEAALRQYDRTDDAALLVAAHRYRIRTEPL